MDASGAGSRKAYAQSTRPLGISAGIECCRFLVANLDKPDPILARSERLDYAIDAITGKAKNRVDAPVEQSLDQDIRGGRRGH